MSMTLRVSLYREELRLQSDVETFSYTVRITIIEYGAGHLYVAELLHFMSEVAIEVYTGTHSIESTPPRIR